jgi:ABC-type transport system involved in cytochrome bd biosynthesis fused ATPase/permease subunit
VDTVSLFFSQLSLYFSAVIEFAKDSSFTWNTANAAKTLNGLNLRIGQGKLVAVIGGTGSGKSSLLSAMLSDIPSAGAGSGCEVRGNVAYVP